MIRAGEPGSLVRAEVEPDLRILTDGSAAMSDAPSLTTPAPLNRVPAVAGCLIVLAGKAGARKQTGLLFVPAVAAVAFGAAGSGARAHE
jgi:hypothetical protein